MESAVLKSVELARRQSEIRQKLAELIGKAEPTETETREMESLDAEYRSNETKYRAALLVEEEERREAKEELEKRDAAKGDQWGELVSKFEMRQVALHFAEGRELDGATKEVVSELRSKGSYRGVAVPIEALAPLETRAGETLAAGVPDPKTTRPIIDRLFPQSCAARMQAQLITIDHGITEFPVVTSNVAAAWAATETGNVGDPQAYQTTDRPLRPNFNLGVTMKLTRRSLLQAGAALEAAVRRDMQGCVAQALDRAVFLGSGEDGQPLGIIPGAEDFGITETPVDAPASWAAFREAVTNFIIRNAANGPTDVRLLIRPEIFDAMDDELIDGTSVSEWDRLLRHIPAGNIIMSSNALDAPGSPPSSTALLTTARGIAPIFVGVFGALDIVRDPFSDAASGGLRLTGIVTADVTISRSAQLEVLTGIE